MSTALACLGVGVALLSSAAPVRAAGPPIVESTWVTDVTATSLNLHARVNPNGLTSSYRFEYVTQAAYETSGFSGAAFAPPSGSGGLGAGKESIAVVQHVAALAPTTTYRYRIRAANTTTVFGPERTLTTEVPSNVFELPDERAWELVSPIDKDGGAIAAPETLFGGGTFQAAAQGGAVTYGSAFSFAGGPGALGADQYVSTRSSAGWSTANVTTPMVSGSYGDEPDGTPYRIFSTDLSKALLSNGVRCRSAGTDCPVANPPLPGSGAPAGYRNYYLRASNGSFSALLGSADVAVLPLAADEFELALAGATPDLAQVVLSSCAKLTADATEVPAPGGCEQAEQNLYLWSGGGLRLVNVLPGDSTGTPGAVLAAQSGAISSDGSRVYFTMLEDGPVYLRDAGQTKLLPKTEGGGPSFQAASGDGAVAYFTKGGTLYRYDAEAEGSEPIDTGVTGVLGIAADGSYVYFQDASGLRQWHGGTVTTIAPGADATMPQDYPPATGTARTSADGRSLAFLSTAELSGYDNTDANKGTPDTELYLYREAAGGGGSLVCASCNPTGERPEGSASIPGAYANGSTRAYKPRVLSSSGSRLFFDSADRLAVTDTDSRPDVYQWEAQGVGDCSRSPGCVSLISEAHGGGGSFVDASADGDDVFFLTAESSVGSDPGSVDLYDARVGGGLPEAPAPFVCLADACQALPSPPDDPTPGTLVLTGGNPQPQIVKHKQKHKKKKRHRRRHHHRGPR